MGCWPTTNSTGSWLTLPGNYQHAKVLKGQIAYNVGTIRRSGELDGESQVEFVKTDAIEWNHPFSVGLWANPSNISIGRKDIGLLDKSSEGEDRRGFELFYEEIQKMPRFKRGSRVNRAAGPPVAGKCNPNSHQTTRHVGNVAQLHADL